jgi:hypothetical protein
VVDRLFEGEEAVLHEVGWVGRPCSRGRFVDIRSVGWTWDSLALRRLR